MITRVLCPVLTGCLQLHQWNPRSWRQVDVSRPPHYSIDTLTVQPWFPGHPLLSMGRYSLWQSEVISEILLLGYTEQEHTPPLSFFRIVIAGGLLFNRMPNPSSSLVRIARSFSGFNTSSIMKIRLHVRATAITCRPRPLPSLAPSIIPTMIHQLMLPYRPLWGGEGKVSLPGKSRTWILAPLCVRVPGTVVSVVNSYEATSEWVPLRSMIHGTWADSS